MIAVILAAGVGSRLESLTLDRPKCLIEIAGKPILQSQIEHFAGIGVRKIWIVLGYQHAKVEKFINESPHRSILFPVINKDFESTSNAWSLNLLEPELNGVPFVLANGDIRFDSRVAKSLVQAQDDSIIVDPNTFDDESMKVVVNADNQVVQISKSISVTDSYATSLDLYKFGGLTSGRLFRYLQEFLVSEGRYKWTETALDDLIDSGQIQMRPHCIDPGALWMEIDTQKDLMVAESLFSPIRGQIQNYSWVFLDIDGTLRLENALISGAIEAVCLLRKQNLNVRFLTNNSSLSRQQHAKDLQSLGLDVTIHEIVSCVSGVISWLHRQRITRVFVLGTSSLTEELREAGVDVKSMTPEIVVVGFDTSLTYDGLMEAAHLITAGVPYVLTHGDLSCPTARGPIPDCGAIARLLAATTNIEPLLIFGKPAVSILQEAMNTGSVGDFASSALVIGDRLETDMLMARNAGAGSVLVLSGSNSRVELEESQFKPDLVSDSLLSAVEVLVAHISGQDLANQALEGTSTKPPP